MNRYAVINSANIVVNMVLWDGTTDWTPGNDADGNPLTVVPDTDPPTANNGLLYSNGQFVTSPI